MASREEIIAQKEKTSLAIIQAALELCAEEGFASLSLRSVARKAGIAPTSFYRHFRDIDELGISIALAAKKILDECLEDVRNRIELSFSQKSDSDMDVMSAIDAFVHPFAQTFMNYFETHNYLLRLFFQERTGSSTALRSTISIENEKLIDFLSEDLKKFSHLTGKNIEDIRLLAETMLTIIMASGMEKMVNPESHDEIISKAMDQKLSLLIIGAVNKKE
jgi:AcrR family transcriptional regulator